MHRVQQRHIWLGCYERKVQKTKTLFIMLCTACPLTGLINIRFGLSCRQRVSWGALWFTKLWSVLPKRSTQKGKWHTGSWMSGNFEENKCMFLRFSGSCFRSKQFSSSSSPEESQQSLLLKRSPPVKGSSSFPLLPKGVHKGSSDCWRFSLLYCDQYSYIWDHKIKKSKKASAKTSFYVVVISVAWGLHWT